MRPAFAWKPQRSAKAAAVAPIVDLTVGQVSERLGGLAPSELRRVRDYERRRANRKSVLDAIEKALD